MRPKIASARKRCRRGRKKGGELTFLHPIPGVSRCFRYGVNMRPDRIAFFALGLGLALSAYAPSSAQECLSTRQQLLERRVSERWRELHQKDNQPLFLTISAGQGKELQFVGKKPDGSTWISGAMSICSYEANKYQVRLERIDQAPFLVGSKLTGMSDTISAGSSHIKFGSGQRCGNPDPCIEFTAD